MNDIRQLIYLMIGLAVLVIICTACKPIDVPPESVRDAKAVSVNKCEQEVEYYHARLHRINQRTASAWYAYCRGIR